jgi:DNA-binding PadR family transcriptional regulator
MVSARVTEKQRAVLLGVRHYVNEHDRPAGEYGVHRMIRDHNLWPGDNGWVYLHGHLKKLTDRGLLERHGVRGGYCYSLTPEGRDVLTEGAA